MSDFEEHPPRRTGRAHKPNIDNDFDYPLRKDHISGSIDLNDAARPKTPLNFANISPNFRGKTPGSARRVETSPKRDPVNSQDMFSDTDDEIRDSDMNCSQKDDSALPELEHTTVDMAAGDSTNEPSDKPSDISDLTSLVMQLKAEMVAMKESQTKMLGLLEFMMNSADSEKRLRIEAQEELRRVKDIAEEKAKHGTTKSPYTPSTSSIVQSKTKDLAVEQVQITGPLTPSAPPLTPTQRPLIPNAPPKPSLLLGTSLLRNVDSKTLDNVEVLAKGGAKIEAIHAMLNQLPDDKHYANITIVGGSVDLEQTKSEEDIVSDYEAMMVSASLRSDNLSVCGILPRQDLAGKRQRVNESLEKACNNISATYIDVDETFILRNGSINDANFAQDGLHLSKYGVDNLLRICNIPLKENKASAFTNNRYRSQKRIYFRGHEHPLSNFYTIKGFSMNGIPFATTEAAYVYEKAMHHNLDETAEKARKCRTGLQAKRLGDDIETDARWQHRKVDVMDNIIRWKLKVCPAVRKTLLDSEDRELIEDTPHEFWGRGKSDTGENMLGELWMLHRKKLKTNQRNRLAQTWATRDQQPRCYKCGEHGHLLEQCRQVKPLICWSCGYQGHKRKHCRTY